MLSWDEVYGLSQLSLRRFFKNEGEEANQIIEELGEYFSKLIFDLVKIDRDKEIDMKIIKEVKSKLIAF